MKDLDQLGTQADMVRRQEQRVYHAAKVVKARNLIYKKAKPITGANVEALLKEYSAVPTIVRLILYRSLNYSNGVL